MHHILVYVHLCHFYLQYIFEIMFHHRSKLSRKIVNTLCVCVCIYIYRITLLRCKGIFLLYQLFFLEGYSAGFSDRYGSHVWEVLQMTLKDILAQVPVSGPVNLLYWLKETNRRLAKSEEWEIEEIKYKPLLSICHTLTKNIIFDTNNE